FEYEDRVFRCWSLPTDRTRVQVGSIQGEVFTSPPEAKGGLAARIKEAGRCGREYVVTRSIIQIMTSSTMRCREPGHRVQVAIERPRGPGRWDVRHPRHAYLVHILAGRLGSAHCLFVRECLASSSRCAACGRSQI